MRNILSLSLLLLVSCATYYHGSPTPETVRNVDLSRYAGLWYELARLPNSFQCGCTDSTAEYAVLSETEMSVINACKRDGHITSITGRARVADRVSNSKLKVRFDPFPVRLFEGDYWIVELDPDYQWVAVSNGSGRYLWILSRTPVNPDYEKIVQRLSRRGFATEHLIRTSD